MSDAVPENPFAGVYAAAPVSLWIEDYSGIKALFDRLRIEAAELSTVVGARSDAARADAQHTYDRFVALVFITLGAVVVMTAGCAARCAARSLTPAARSPSKMDLIPL